MDKMEAIISELTELTKSNRIHWKPKFEGYVVCEDFKTVEYAIFLRTKKLCFNDKTLPGGGRLYTPPIFNAMTSVFELCKAVEAQIGGNVECVPEEKFILDVCLDDIADFKSRS